MARRSRCGRRLTQAGLELWDIGQTTRELKTVELAVKANQVLEWVQDRLETTTEDQPPITLDLATHQRVQDKRPLVQDYLSRKGRWKPDWRQAVAGPPGWVYPSETPAGLPGNQRKAMKQSTKTKITLGICALIAFLFFFLISGFGLRTMRDWAVASPDSGLSKPMMKMVGTIYRVTMRRENAAYVRRDFYRLWPGDSEAGDLLADAGLELWDIGQTTEDLKTTEMAVKALQVMYWIQDRLDQSTDIHPQITSLSPELRRRIDDKQEVVEDFLQRKGLWNRDDGLSDAALEKGFMDNWERPR